MSLAKRLAAEKASVQGVAMVGIRRVCWLGAMGPYVVSLVRKGFMAQLWSNTTTCKDCAPFGGVDAKFSTNPVALGFPTGGHPVISDFSTASTSMGKLKQMVKRGEKAPESIFLDREGNLSRDPQVVIDGGSIIFIGGANYGFRGFGMSLWCEATAALAGGECNNPDTKTTQSVNLTVIDPESFAGADYYTSEIERFKRHMLENRVRPGFDRIRLPGERLFESLERSETEGIEVDEAMVANLNRLAVKHNIDALG
jgi:LDH2 family malate/lactate/ureidoglycolate dehydrogenase